MGERMKALLPEQEVAELLGRSTRTVRRRAGEFMTQPAAEAARNGRKPRMYDLGSLPPEAALDWAEREKQNVVPIVAPPGQLALGLTAPEGPNLSVEDRAQAERRFRVIEPLIRPERYAALWAQYKRKGTLIAVLAKENNTKPRTVYHWLKAYRDGGLPALVDKDRSDKGRPRAFNNAALDFLLAAALPRKGAYGELSIAEIFRAYNEERAWRLAHAGKPLDEFGIRKYARYLDGDKLSAAAQLPAASYETFRAWFDRIPEVVRVMAREGGEAFASSQEILSFRNLTELKPLDYVVMDHRRLDLFCMVPDGKDKWKLIRPWLTAAIDMRTRKWLAWVIVENPSSESIAATLKRAFIDHGLPVAVYWDNGKDFTCIWLEGRHEHTGRAGRVGELDPAWRGVLDTLGVRVHHAIAYRARAKIIEPCFRATALYDKSTPWWCGHKPQARPERFDALLAQHERWLAHQTEERPFPTIEEVAGLYDEMLQAVNEREHPGDGMAKITPTGRGWMSPNECWKKLIGQVGRRTVPADVLQFAFAKRRTCTVRNGELRVTFGGRPYHYRLIGNSVGLMAFNGREVEFAYDPMDLQTVAVYCESRLLGLANDIELRHMGEEDFVQDEKDRRVGRQKIKKFIQAVHQAVYVPDVVERAARRQAVTPARIEPQRAEVAAAAPPEVMEAARAAEQDKSFSFERADDMIRLAAAKAYQDDDPDDDEFSFFGGTNEREPA
jgi:transposase